jgi:PP-loop superfamily ATP-utilizing enzyme
MDRQLDRMQQGQLFSPEMLQKIAQIQDLVRQIQNPEFQRRMEQMREAMRSLDPKEVQKALQEMKLTQRDIEQGLDRTLKMLERLLAEEKLDELIKIKLTDKT